MCLVCVDPATAHTVRYNQHHKTNIIIQVRYIDVSQRDLANVTPATCLMRWMTLFSSSGVVTGLSASSRCCCLMCVSGRFLRLTVAVRSALDLGDCSDSTSCTLLNSSSTHTEQRERNRYHFHCFFFILEGW